MKEADDNVAAWREVHSALLTAVQKAKAAVAILKVERRYLLEEIAWNLDDSGQVASHSAWKRPIVGVSATKTETNVKRKSIGLAVKRKKSLPEKSGQSSKKETKKRKKSEIEAPPKKATKIILKRTKLSTEPTAFKPTNGELDNVDHSESEREQEIAALPHDNRDFYSEDTSREQTPSQVELYDETARASMDSEAQNSSPGMSSSIYNYKSPSSFLPATGSTPTPSSVSTQHQPPPIRNYTSLQDIAMNDESDEDRF